MKEISLTQGKVAFVDDEDFLKISKFRWYAHPSGNTWYAVRSVPTIDGKQRTEHMHVIIAGTPEGMETDHINGNGLDNRRENLRIVTTRGNAQNRHTSKTSKYPGVSWDKCRRKWRAQIRINGKVKRLGLYRDEETAGMAYALACNSVKIEETP